MRCLSSFTVEKKCNYPVFASISFYYTRERYDLPELSSVYTRERQLVWQIFSLAGISEHIKSQISSIPWKQIYGMRNRIVHGYDGIEMKIVWETIEHDLPVLKKELKNIL